nr:MAG TPA: antitoxin [Caudoviricetes sp.]
MKTEVITLRIEESLKKKFKEQCEANGQNMSKVIELMIKKSIQENNK